MKKIAMSSIEALFSKIAGDQPLVMPIMKAGQANFLPWSEGAETALAAIHTVKSPKDMFFPQSEDIVGFKMEGKKIEIIEGDRADAPFVLFGVHACDCRAIDVLDKVFLADPVDTFYAARRNAGTVVTLACNKPEETCFCNVFGIDPTEPAGDVSCWIENGELFWRANTEKGEKLTALVADVLTDADEAAVEAQKEATKAIMEKLPLAKLSLKGFDGEHLMEKFNSPAWAELYKCCLGCGTCTFVCPTCQCYEVRDYDNGHGIQRFRCWDSCMYKDFTMMSHGTNRKTQMERFRQRFMHKLVYFPSNNDGMYSCVGCGRCVSKCPVSMNIAKVMKALGEEE